VAPRGPGDLGPEADVADPRRVTRPRVLVTGGAGFVGANLVRRLVDEHEIRVLDSGVARSTNVLPAGVERVEADIRDTAAVRDAMSGVSAVVHLAAAGNVVESVADPGANFDVNVRGSLSVLDAARAAGVERLVVASTGGALMGNAPGPVDETSVPRPLSPYGASKAAVEAYCHAYAGSYGLRTVILRFANLYGPFSAHKKGVVTAFFRALDAGQPLVVYGDGQASRDFMYVDDICSAIERALSADVPGGTTAHVATGIETTVDELAALCSEVAGRPGHPVEHRPARTGEVERNVGSYQMAQKLLGFEPSVSLREGLEATWRWYQQSLFR
jgi:UDP-glucose 4-epimerase